VREKLVDQVIMSDSFRPGDYIKAKVISLGDSLRNLYLSTAGEDLGVLVSKNEKSENLMLPFDWESMVDPVSNDLEKRKVARP
jgi:exosome complex component CSL4